MRPSTTDACTVLRRRALRTTSTPGAARLAADGEVELQLVERIRHAAPQIWPGVVTATSWGSTRITRSPSVRPSSVTSTQRPPRFGRRAHPPPRWASMA